MCYCVCVCMCTCVQALTSKLPKQISWRFTVTHVSPVPLPHTVCVCVCVCVCVYVRDQSESVCTALCLARGQHSTAASVWRQTEDIYSLVNTHWHKDWQRGETEAALQWITPALTDHFSLQLCTVIHVAQWIIKRLINRLSLLQCV